MSGPLHLKIFLSSPGDVAEERDLARRLIKDELPYDPLLRGKVTFDVLSWDDPAAGVPLLASMTPQEAVNQGLGRPADCDITVVILWSRLGSPLRADAFRKPDGEPYWSGTEWEYEDARAAGHDVLIYRRIAPVSVDIKASDLDERREQMGRVEEFFARFRNADGSFNAAASSYVVPADLKERLEKDLKALVARRLEPSGAEARTQGTLLNWLKVPDAAGEPNGAMCCAYEEIHYEALRFSGDNEHRQLTNNLYKWRGKSWSPIVSSGLRSSKHMPKARGNACMVFDSARRVFVLFGGWIDGNNFYDETWEYNHNKWTKIKLGELRPHARANHTMVYDPIARKVLLFGGSYGGDFFDDTWEYDASGWKKLPDGLSPSPRIFSRMVYDEERRVTVLFGGQKDYDTVDEKMYLGDTWFFCKGIWQLIKNSGEGPSPRSWHAMTYDPNRKKIILFGGGGHGRKNSFNDTWEWDGISWNCAVRDDNSRLPLPRVGACLFFDKSARMPTLFGGYNGWRVEEVYGDTWRYTAGITATLA